MKITVFGGSGFLGSHICDKLSEAGHDVTIVDVQPSPWLRPDQHMLTGSILDEALVEQAVSGADVVFNYAGIADIGEANRQGMGRNRQVPGRRNLLELLPDEFTFEDAVRVRQWEGLDAKGTSNMLRQWKHRRYVTIVTNDNYQKLKFRRDGNDIDKNRQA